MGRLLGGWRQVCWEGGSIPVWACRDVTGQGRNKAGTCSFSQPQPCMERGCPALGGLSRVRGHCFVGGGTTQRLAGRKDPQEHWGSLRHCSWQWFEDITGRWKSFPQSLGHSWGWYTCVYVCVCTCIWLNLILRDAPTHPSVQGKPGADPQRGPDYMRRS